MLDRLPLGTPAAEPVEVALVDELIEQMLSEAAPRLDPVPDEAAAASASSAAAPASPAAPEVQRHGASSASRAAHPPRRHSRSRSPRRDISRAPSPIRERATQPRLDPAERQRRQERHRIVEAPKRLPRREIDITVYSFGWKTLPRTQFSDCFSWDTRFQPDHHVMEDMFEVFRQRGLTAQTGLT